MLALGGVVGAGLPFVITSLNMLSVESFGEAEYRFAGIEILAIAVFLGIALA